MNYHLTPNSKNIKVGESVSVSTSSKETCPDSCFFKRTKTCYASSGPINVHWNKVTEKERGTNWNDFIQNVKNLPDSHKFRFNQAGDLPGVNNSIDNDKLQELSDVIQLKKLKAWSYTHKPLTTEHVGYLKSAIKKGFTINVSTENLDDADAAKKLNLPVVVVLNTNSEKTVFTKENNKVVVCPAQYKENSNCSNCMLCFKADRSVIVGFLAHSVMKNKIDKLLK